MPIYDVYKVRGRYVATTEAKEPEGGQFKAALIADSRDEAISKYKRIAKRARYDRLNRR